VTLSGLISDLALNPPQSWPVTFAYAISWCAGMLAYSPVADWIASRIITEPPDLRAFRALQRSRLHLVIGIAAALLLGGVLEELVLRGVILRGVAITLAPLLGDPIATTSAVLAAALTSALLHLYQGPRAVIIVGQLSALFGMLYVVTGYDLWAAIICHGLYDTVAFVRFANKSSKYAKLD
jgi:membrane protease YdiL (CAAX protease family)